MFPGAAKEARIYPAFEGEHCLQSASSKKRHKVWFAQSWDGYRVNTTDKYNNGRLDTHIIARAIHYACRHTPHLKHCLQQESIAACQPRLMRSLSKTGKTFERERLAKKTLLQRTRMWLNFIHFPPHLSPDLPRCFVSQELWSVFLMRKLILQQPHPAPGSLALVKHACVYGMWVRVKQRSADTTK